MFMCITINTHIFIYSLIFLLKKIKPIAEFRINHLKKSFPYNGCKQRMNIL